MIIYNCVLFKYIYKCLLFFNKIKSHKLYDLNKLF